jgi:lipopolysaccharide transport system permease protein
MPKNVDSEDLYFNQRTIITSDSDSFSKYIINVKRHFPLAVSLAKRELLQKYAQSKVGFIWSIIQPLTAFIIYTFFFKYVFKIDFDDYPYSLFVISGVIPWYYFMSVVHHGATALVANQDLIRKVAFPRIILVLSKALVGLFDLFLGLILLLVLLAIYGLPIFVGMLFLPIVVLQLMLFSLVLPIWVSILSIKNRDLLHLIPYLTNFGIWLTPVFYNTSILPDAFQWVVSLNPFTQVLEFFRWSLFASDINWTAQVITSIILITFLLVGVWVYSKRDKMIIDRI